MTRAGTAPGSTLCPTPPCGDKPRTPRRDRDTPDPLPPPLRVPSPSSRAGRVFRAPRGWREAAPPFIPSEPPKPPPEGPGTSCPAWGRWVSVCPSSSLRTAKLCPQGEHHSRGTLGQLFFNFFFTLHHCSSNRTFILALNAWLCHAFNRGFLTQRIFWGG